MLITRRSKRPVLEPNSSSGQFFMLFLIGANIVLSIVNVVGTSGADCRQTELGAETCAVPRVTYVLISFSPVLYFIHSLIFQSFAIALYPSYRNTILHGLLTAFYYYTTHMLDYSLVETFRMWAYIRFSNCPYMRSNKNTLCMRFHQESLRTKKVKKTKISKFFYYVF